MNLKVKRSAVSAAGVLPAAEPTHAPRESATYSSGTYKPAPAGTLHRGYQPVSSTDDGNLTGNSPWADKDDDYIPRRGRSLFQQRLRRLPRSMAGRITLGVAALIVLSATALGLAAARHYILHDPRFLLASGDDIQITGNAHLTREQVVSVFAGDLERSIFRLSLAERQADLERLPWVDHAVVMRLLPNTIRVAITERTPVAFVRQGTQIGLVDAAGVLLDMPAADAGDPRYSFPVLTGVNATEPLATRASRVDLYRRFLKALTPAAAEGLSEVDVSDPEDVKALMPTGTSDILVHFGDRLFEQRYADYEAHLTEWRQHYPKLASADMRYQGQVVLEMTQGGPPTSVSDGTVSAPITIAPAAAALAPAPLAPAPPAPAPQTAAVTPAPAAALATVIPSPAARMAGGPSSRAPITSPKVTTDAKGAKGWVASTANQPPLPSHPPTPKPAAFVVARQTPKATPKPVFKPVKAATAASGRSASNERMFAALAAARKAQERQAPHPPAGGGR